MCEALVLRCDDDDFNLMTLSMMLDDLDVKCATFNTGAQAVQFFQQRLLLTCCSRSFKLVLTDIQMPGMNGFEVCTNITATQNSWFAGMQKQQNAVKFKARTLCPVVAITAFTDESVQQEAMKVGFLQVMNKPVS
jgi:CheY-like chemotaxis protein